MKDLPTLDNLHGLVKLPEDMETHAHNLELAYVEALKRLALPPEERPHDEELNLER